MGKIAITNPPGPKKASKGGKYSSRLKRDWKPTLMTGAQTTATVAGASIGLNLLTNVLITRDQDANPGLSSSERAKRAGNRVLAVSGAGVVAGLALTPIAPIVAIGLIVGGGLGLVRQAVGAMGQTGAKLASVEAVATDAQYRMDPGFAEAEMAFQNAGRATAQLQGDINPISDGGPQAQLYRVG